ncbi:uncharacterized protein LOC127801843 isoform X2 [Diospyros lotus]|uniref:uncharacterized protein LOC127801843 isoform X2 n=1 Tax=Diospyros lotus TaxID=55363 RepID=UPI002253FF03|nr:uncharacterized protein LOC127801843 isoform X2 [Diospyros lotus]
MTITMMSTPGSNNLDDAGDGNGSSRSSFLTNWTVAGGSLQVSCTVESSDSPIDSETVFAEPKPRLVLKRPSPDSGPCEITINFAQKHEVRQVYVRSTARVYEIYFAPSVQSGNEYLCTVRCSIVVRDDVLLVTETDAASGAQGEGSTEVKVGEKCNNDGNIASNEHDWIEVEVPDSSLQDNQYNSVSKKVDPCPGTCVQDFYEATAEITDGDICKSLTLRLLSSQNKDCLYVDEIYVFADPVESADSDTQTSQVGNSAGSSLMAMLVPTLLQLSKKADNHGHASDTSEKREQLEVGSRVSHSLNIANKTQQEESIAAWQEVKLHEANEATPETPDLLFPEKIKDGEQRPNFVSKTDVSSDRIERALEQLVSRVSRIEDICLRFEEHMLNPINNMEARLQRVEQQLEILTKNSQFTGLPPSTRISAPAFSCIGSNLSSLYNEGSDYPACGTLQFEKEDFSSDKLSDPADDTFVSVNDTQFLPSLVVTAPEFPCGDDEENVALEPLEDHPKEKSKQALSIDDALAAALAGFLYTTSVQHSHYSQTLTVKAPDFSLVEFGDDGKVAPPSAQSGKPSESDEMEQVNDPVMTSSIGSPILRMGQVTRDSSNDYLKEAFEGADGQDQLDEVLASYMSPGNPVNCPVVQVEHESRQTDDRQIAEPTSREGTNGVSISVSESTDFMKQFPGAQTEDTPDTVHEVAAASFEDHGGSEKCYQMLTCLLPRDFELPILDVKFASCETSSCYPSLEHLFCNVPEVDAEAQLVQPRDDGVIGEQSNLILVEDAKPSCSGTGLPLVDCNSYNVKGVPTAESKTKDSNACNESEVFASLI